ncbi:MAG: twin-arginine translocase TatA/TatE family subunit [Negativicutes bacterium]|nr:twin-arginine translocase TatA/TatE family subunit [Negativicutes bacterium]
MFNFSVPELILVLVIALVVFGPAKLPEIGKAVGKSIREFRSATTDMKEEVNKTVTLDAPPSKEQGK